MKDKRINLLRGYRNGPVGYKDDTAYDFPVLRERHFLTNGQDTKIDDLYRGDNGAYLASVSPKYMVTTHKEANDFIEQMLTKQGIRYEIGHTALANKGNRFFREFRFPDMKFVPDGAQNTALDGGATNDEYCPTIIARNSYDRTSTLDFYFGGFRFICSNGLMIGEIIQHVSIKHNVVPEYRIVADGFLDRIEQSVEGFKRTYETLNNQPADPFLQILLLETFSKQAAVITAALSQGLITLEFDKNKVVGVKVSPQLSAYAALQLATNVATHSVRKFHRSIAMQRQISKVFSV